MKNSKYCAAAMLLIIALLAGTACRSALPQADAPAVTAAQADFAVAGTPDAAISFAQQTPAPTAAPVETTADGQAEAHAAYRLALTALAESGTLPDGTQAGAMGYIDSSENQFAVLDIDADGSDELLLILRSETMAGETQYIFGFDAAENRLFTEFSEYPLLTFYNNGIIRADWSHNQGLAGEFWPFTLYRYDAAADAYQNIGMVDAWDRNFTATGSDGAPYPIDVDTSGTGFVYYIMENGVYEAVAPVDASLYRAWLDARLDGAAEVVIPYTALTKEAVAALQ